MTSKPTSSDAVRQRAPAQVHRELDRFVLIDVREPFELDGPLGHLPGTRRIDRSELPERAAELEGRSLLLVCRSGRRSDAACRTLQEHGDTDVTNLEGGMIAWHAAGLAVERTPAESPSAFAEALARWTAMLSQTPLDEVLARWPALGGGEMQGHDPSALDEALDAIEAHFRHAGAPPDLAISKAVFRDDLDRLR